MSSPKTSRRQRAAQASSAAFSSPNLGAFLRCEPVISTQSVFTEKSCLPTRPTIRTRLSVVEATVKTRPRPKPKAAKSISPAPPTFTAPTQVLTPTRQSRKSRYVQPVPDPLPHEILPCRRGRNSRRRVREAEHFRRYIRLRRQLKPWSDSFREKHGRTPSLIDVHASDIPGLLDRFVEYLEALDGLRLDV